MGTQKADPTCEVKRSSLHVPFSQIWTVRQLYANSHSALGTTDKHFKNLEKCLKIGGKIIDSKIIKLLNHY